MLPWKHDVLIEDSLQTTVWIAFDGSIHAAITPGQPVVKKIGTAGVSKAVLLRNTHVPCLEPVPGQQSTCAPDRTLWLADRRVTGSGWHGGVADAASNTVFTDTEHFLIGFVGPMRARTVDGILHLHVVVAGRVRANCAVFGRPLAAGTVVSMCGRNLTTLVPSAASVPSDFALICLHPVDKMRNCK